MKYVACLLLLVGGAAPAQQAADCAEIRDTDDRLACFDRLFPDEQDVSSAGGRPSGDDGSSAASSAAAATIGKKDAASDAPPVTSVDETRNRADDHRDPPKKGGLFANDERVNLTTKIKALHQQPQQPTAFLLENDEIWLQSSSRALPIRVGDTVTIRNARFFGGYMMTTERGLTTRVKRIR